jgi:hypothetical protein
MKIFLYFLSVINSAYRNLPLPLPLFSVREIYSRILICHNKELIHGVTGYLTGLSCVCSATHLEVTSHSCPVLMFFIFSWPCKEDRAWKTRSILVFERYSVDDTVIRQAMGWTLQDSEFGSPCGSRHFPFTKRTTDCEKTISGAREMLLKIRCEETEWYYLA